MSKRFLYSINFVSLAVFLVLLFLVSIGNWLPSIDAGVASRVVFIRGPIWNVIMYFFTFLGNGSTVLFFSALMMVVLFREKKFQHALVFGAAIIGSSYLADTVKSIVARARPTGEIIAVGGYSFPSGHAMTAGVFAAMLVYFFSVYFPKGKARNYFVCFNVFLVLAVGFSRIYFDVHWFSDVLAGFSLALFWSTLVIIVAMTLGLEKPLSK